MKRHGRPQWPSYFVLLPTESSSLYQIFHDDVFVQYNSPFGKAEAYDKQEQLGEGSYATVYKGRSL